MCLCVFVCLTREAGWTLLNSLQLALAPAHGLGFFLLEPVFIPVAVDLFPAVVIGLGSTWSSSHRLSHSVKQGFSQSFFIHVRVFRHCHEQLLCFIELVIANKVCPYASYPPDEQHGIGVPLVCRACAVHGSPHPLREHASSRSELAAGDSFSTSLALSAVVDWPSATFFFPSPHGGFHVDLSCALSPGAARPSTSLVSVSKAATATASTTSRPSLDATYPWGGRVSGPQSTRSPGQPAVRATSPRAPSRRHRSSRPPLPISTSTSHASPCRESPGQSAV